MNSFSILGADSRAVGCAGQVLSRGSGNRRGCEPARCQLWRHPQGSDTGGKKCCPSAHLYTCCVQLAHFVWLLHAVGSLCMHAACHWITCTHAACKRSLFVRFSLSRLAQLCDVDVLASTQQIWLVHIPPPDSALRVLHCLKVGQSSVLSVFMRPDALFSADFLSMPNSGGGVV